MKLLLFCALMSLSGRGGEKNTGVRRKRRRRYKIPTKKKHYCPIYVPFLPRAGTLSPAPARRYSLGFTPGEVGALSFLMRALLKESS